MTESLGLSIGATNLAAAREDPPAVIRPSTLTLFSHRPPEVGHFGTEQGMLLTGFVDQVGDPVPLVAPDGSRHLGERLLAEALESMVYLAGAGSAAAPVATSVPAHWCPPVVAALRCGATEASAVYGCRAAADFRCRCGINGATSQSGAAVRRGRGAVRLRRQREQHHPCRRRKGFTPVGETVRYTDFSGDHIDQAILTQVMAGNASDTDPSRTAMVVAISRT